MCKKKEKRNSYTCMPRLINCKGCGGYHHEPGGSRCVYKRSFEAVPSVIKSEMLEPDPDSPTRDSPEYQSYLESKIAEQELRLEKMEDERRVVELERKLAGLQIRKKKMEEAGHYTLETPSTAGFAGRILSGQDGSGGADIDPGSKFSTPMEQHRSKAEQEIISKLRPNTYLSEPKIPEKTTYRDFIHGMSKVMQFVIDVGGNPKGYAAHMAFISSKAATNYYVTDSLIRYELAVTDKVISGVLPNWLAADPESVAMYMGADATYAVRGRSGWTRHASGNSGGSRDFLEWPREVCWLYNHTNCYLAKCRRSHVCAKCRKSGHSQKECVPEHPSAAMAASEPRPKPADLPRK